MPAIILTIIVAWFWPHFASAHSFGILYNLPVPFWMYLYGSAAAIIVSFLVIGYFFKSTDHNLSPSTISLPWLDFLSLQRNPAWVKILKVASLTFLTVTILSGLFERSSYSSFSMTFFWIIFLLGFTYATALVGNIFSVINPWRVLVDWLLDHKSQGIVSYPKNLSYYPALIFYFILIWFELIGRTSPHSLSTLLIIYTIITSLGAIAFGSESWFKYGEFFNVFFSLIGKMSPLEYRSGHFYLRAPIVGLLKESAEHFSLLLFTLFMLSSTAFDGFKETLPWVRFYWQYLNPFLKPFFGSHSYAVAETLVLLLSPFIFLSLYVLLIALAKVIARNTASLMELFLQFTFSLIPIAFVYNVAHYYTLVLTEGPNIAGLASDPFSFGWNLFGTAHTSYNFVPQTNLVWHFQLLVIILGHIAGVYLSHVIALRNFSASRARIILSQLPMLTLMVIYTVAGLWILSQPITGGTL